MKKVIKVFLFLLGILVVILVVSFPVCWESWKFSGLFFRGCRMLGEIQGPVITYSLTAFGYYDPPKDFLKALDAGENAILYALDPSKRIPILERDPAVVDKVDKGEKFYNYKIIQRINLQGTEAVEARMKVRDAIAPASDEWTMCFDPHHALSVTYEGHIYDMVICFQCKQINYYKDGKFVFTSHTKGDRSGLDGLMPFYNNTLP